jgi:hypothetical protein
MQQPQQRRQQHHVTEGAEADHERWGENGRHAWGEDE